MLWRLTNPNLPGWVDAPGHQHAPGLEQGPEPLGVGGGPSRHQRTSTSASTATGRPSTTISGLRSADAMSSRSVAAASDRPEQHVDDRRPVDRRLAAERPEQRLERQVVDHLLGVDPVDRHQPEAHVGHRLGQDAADAEHHGHAELRVVVQPGDQLAGGPQHRRHQQVHLAVVGRRRAPAAPRPPRAPARPTPGRAAPGPARSCGRCRRPPA